jgi:hypothetical protein
MKSELSASFMLLGQEFDPAQVTAWVGLTPSRTWRIGDLVQPPAILRHKRNGWVLDSTLPASADLEEHVKSVLERLQPSWAVLVELALQYDTVISCVVYSYGGDRPAMHFDKDIVKRAAELNAAIDIDLYIFDDDP